MLNKTKCSLIGSNWPIEEFVVEFNTKRSNEQVHLHVYRIMTSGYFIKLLFKYLLHLNFQPLISHLLTSLGSPDALGRNFGTQ